MPGMREVIEFSKDLPQVGVVAISLFGVSLQTWVLVLTAIWALFRAGIAFYDLLARYETWRTRKRKEHNEQSNRDQAE